ncbi:MAG TPA: 6-bladed beta-propeller [Thermoanaerobaculia bacterium]|nr:6-bladed beta-propeller [Thermoanaerobaculia bacterium]
MWFLISGIGCAATISPAAFGQSFAKAEPLERVTLASQTGVLHKVISAGDRMYLLDTQNHQIHIFSGTKATTVGQIGNGKGDLYQPFDFAVDESQRIYVKDGGNSRIQMFDAQQHDMGSFPDNPKSLGLAVNARGEIFLGQPQLGSLISVYDTHGRTLRSFGAPVLPSVIYGARFKRFDGYKTAFNRVRIATDESGNVWAAFVYLPLLYKFDALGHLLFQKRLQYPELDPVVASVGVQPPPPEYASMNFDGIQMTVVISDITYDRRSKTVFLLLGNDRAIVLDGTGHDLYGFRPAAYVGALQNMAVQDNGEVLVTVFGSPKLYRFQLRKEGR